MIRYAAVLVIVLLSGCARQATPLAMDPAAMHLPGMLLHDPWMVAYQPTRTYYLYTSNNDKMSGVAGAGVMAYASRDLLNWEKPRVVFTVPEGTWADAAANPWAPEVHEYKGRFYLFTTLHNKNTVLAKPPDVKQLETARGTTIAVSESPLGPFELVKKDGPIPPAEFMTLDGTLYIDRGGAPWMVYAHEWVQKVDGTMEAVPLKRDLTSASGPPVHLFKASDAPWLNEEMVPSAAEAHFVTDGPELFRTKDGHLLMLWSSYDKDGYVETVARSKSGEITGPWEQLPPLLRQHSGHGMLFRTFEGQLMLVCHRPFENARGKLYEMRDCGDHLEIVRERLDLDEAH